MQPALQSEFNINIKQFMINATYVLDLLSISIDSNWLNIV